MAYDPSIFNINPYYDDFNADLGFLRVLFRPGYALQARELTQAQSILQNQLSNIGDHLFKDGSRIIGGGLSVRTTSSIRITVASLTAASVTDYTDLIGQEITQNSAATKAKIVNFIPIANGGSTTHLTVIVDFTSGYSFSAATVVYKTTTLTVVGTTESCKLITVGDGIFYVDGFFVPVATHNFTPYRVVGSTLDTAFGGTAASFNALTTRVGFEVVRDTVTSEENSSLRDPAIGSSNYNAPGGDRYKIDLTLDQAGTTAATDDFIELLRFEEGSITRKSERISYAEIEKTLSRRTHEESGSYIVRPFDVNVKDAGGATLSFVMGTGKAYILGHETETQYPETLSIPKARSTKQESGLDFPFSFGNYLSVCMGASLDSGSTFASNLITVGSGVATVTFRNNAAGVVATGYVHGAIPFTTGLSAGHNYNLYLFGLSGSVAGASTGAIYFAADTSFGGGSAGQTLGTFTPANGPTFGDILDAGNNSLVCEIPVGYAVKDITAIEVPGRMWTEQLTTSNGYAYSHPTTTFTINNTHFDAIGTAYTTMDAGVALSDIIIANSEGKLFFPANGTTTASAALGTCNSTQTQFSYGGVGAAIGFTSGNLRAFVPFVYKTTAPDTSTIRTKTVTDFSQTSISTAGTIENGRRVITLGVTDAYSITSITWTTGSVNLIDYFELDDGQRETHYAQARLVVKPSKETDYTTNVVTPATGTLSVVGQFFTHTATAVGAPFCGATSYGGISYENVPLFTNPRTGKTVSLANCLDFRHSGLTATAPLFKPYRSTKPVELTYTHYLPRIDKLCVRNDSDDGSAEFFAVSGTPDMSPTAPPDPLDALVLGSVSIPAYTHNPSDVLITPYENKRYTMQDIGKIEKRIDEVEVFTKLSISEAEIELRSVKTLAGSSVEPLKTSIFAEEFLGHSIGDVASHEHICSVDYELGELRPFFTPTNAALGSFTHAGGTTMSADGLITTAYTGTNYITNTEWTKQIVVNPSNTVNWLGFATITNPIAGAFDLTYRPSVRTNALGENDNWISSNANNAKGFGTQWNDWESLWTGIEDNQNEQDDIQKYNLKTPHVKSTSGIPSIHSGNIVAGVERTILGIDENLSSRIRIARLKNRIKTRVGQRIVDRSVLPYIPAVASVSLSVHGLKPGLGELSIYFDGDSVRSGLSSDAYGSIGTTFAIPANTYYAGEKIVRISDSATSENATTAADAIYYCGGTFLQRDAGSYSTRPPVFRRQTVSSESVVKNPFARDFALDVLENSQWADPLAQTFFVDKKTNPDGIFLKEVGLFFAAKDTNLPVTVQIRPTVNGYPSPSVSLPFATKTLLPTAVAVDTENPVITTFTFSSPVFLEPGEYAMCVITNSDDYTLYAADSGFNALASGSSTAGRVGGNQKVGLLYTSTAIGISVPENSTDLMFILTRCEFAASSSSFIATPSNIQNKQVIKVSASEVIPANCSISRVFTTGNASFKNNENSYPTPLLSPGGNVQYFFAGSNTVSPIVDTLALNATSVSMRTTTSAPSVYVTRVVSVDSNASNGLAVFVDENTPSTSAIAVAYRASSIGTTDILTKSWTTMTRQSTAPISGSDLEYQEGVYGATTDTPFNSYQIKVSMSSSEAIPTYNQTPAVRSIKATSFIR